jgi:hypothetical protein
MRHTNAETHSEHGTQQLKLPENIKLKNESPKEATTLPTLGMR